jgi:serine/threonine-protein kinase
VGADTQDGLGPVRRSFATLGAPRTSLPPEAARESGEDPLVGFVVADRYEVGELIAVGGMGCIYTATERDSGERVALKTLKPHYAEHPQVVQRFERESAALARAADSPYIVGVKSHGKLPDGRAFYVMELLEGWSLGDLLVAARGPLKPARAIRIALQVAIGLEHAHAVGMVHRDLKPENIFLYADERGLESVKILDFGLAKALDGSMDVTKAGEVLGTPGYMAPEQVHAARADERTDIYAFGVMLFEMLTGKLPFEGEGIVGMMIAHVEQPPPLLSEVVPSLKLPTLLEWITRCCLYKDPAKRFATATMLREEVENAANLYRVSL